MTPTARTFTVAAFSLALILQVFYFTLAYPIAVRGPADFSMLYVAGAMVRSGHGSDIYDLDSNTRFQEKMVGPSHGPVPFNHLAYEALLFIPISFLPYPYAYNVFLFLNIALLLISFIRFRTYTTSLQRFWSKLPLAVFVCFLPVGIALFQGQDSILLLALLISSFVAWEKGDDNQAGLFLGLTIFKFQFALPIALLFLAWKKWRVICGFTITATLASLVSVAVTGTGTVLNYAHYLVSVSSHLTTPGQQLKFAIYPLQMPNIFGLLYFIAGNHTLLTVVISLAILVWVRQSLPSYPLAVAVSLLVSYHGLIHDAAILIIPVLLFAEEAISMRTAPGKMIWVSAAVLIYPWLAVSVSAPYSLLALPVLGFLYRPPGVPSLAKFRRYHEPPRGESVT